VKLLKNSLLESGQRKVFRARFLREAGNSVKSVDLFFVENCQAHRRLIIPCRSALVPV
jgi:hypothetical protein